MERKTIISLINSNKINNSNNKVNTSNKIESNSNNNNANITLFCDLHRQLQLQQQTALLLYRLSTQNNSTVLHIGILYFPIVSTTMPMLHLDFMLSSSSITTINHNKLLCCFTALAYRRVQLFSTLVSFIFHHVTDLNSLFSRVSSLMETEEINSTYH